MSEWKGETMDKLEWVDGNLIHHGKESNRIYLMKYASNLDDNMLKKFEDMAVENEYTKFFAKVSETKLKYFKMKGFQIEAQIPKMFESEHTGYFMAKYYDANRSRTEKKWTDAFIAILNSNQNETSYIPKKSEKFNIEILSISDTEDMASLYRSVFETYPFPIFDPGYLRETMKDEVVYFGIRIDDELCAISSSEMNTKSNYAEMTDFAISTSARGLGLSKLLLDAMELEVRKHKITCAFTIARLKSFAMNKTFLRLGYTFAGTLNNNTQIAGNIESMNVFYKLL
jgi:putative beta-lysine N-acetyltransferase